MANGNVVVLAAHPDDEVLGCGGVIARHAAEGATVHIVFVADGVTSRPQVAGTAEHKERQRAAEAAARILGAQAPIFLDFADNRLDQHPLLEIIQSVERVLRDVRPTLVYTHHYGDLNLDHRIVAQAALTACRPQPDSTVAAIYGFEVLSSTEWHMQGNATVFNPVRFVDIAEVLPRKLEALRQYDAEMRRFPHARSCEAIDALVRLRGSSVGIEAAEAFTVYREVVR